MQIDLVMKKIYPLFVLLVVACMLSCSTQPENAKVVGEQPSIYPDYVDVTIPVGIAPLDFSMADDDYTTIDVVVKGEKGQSIHANGDYADFDVEEWHQLVEANKGGRLTFSVCAKKDGAWTQFKDFSVSISKYPLEEWGVTYRRIPPSYEMYSLMGIYERDLSNFEESPLLLNSQTPGMCINCHAPNRTNPEQYVFHVRGEHGATVIHKDGKEELLKAKNDSLGGSMVYPYWHPGGRYCAFSTNKTSQMFHHAKNKRIEVYDSSSDVFVYDTEKHEILNDTIVMRKYWAENCPAFSPDGKWLYFITAKRQVFPTDYDKELYSLCRIGFDENTGKLGETVDTLLSANKLGKSVTWPRPSYDGKYIMYTLADHGYFSIWHPESDLWLYNLEDGGTRCLEEVNSPRADSYHNWSTNSHWFLFTSRRENGLYSRLYLASIDEQGRVTKPFLMPQRDPKRYYTQLLYSYNTPDFTSGPVSLDAREMGQKIESDQRVDTKVKH